MATPTSAQPPNDLFSNLVSGVGTGLGIYDQGQAYSGLQSVLNTIGPTALQPWSLGGPGGMSSGFNPANGSANINLGSLSPAFANLAAAGAAGSGSYNPGLPGALSGAAVSTLNPSLSTLFGAYGNYGQGMNAANTQLGNLGDFNSNYNNLLGAMRGQLAPQVQQQAYGLQNTLFGNGVADSTGAASGSLAAQNFGRGVGQADASAQLAAFQQALGQQTSAAQNYGTLTNSANSILSNAFNNFGNTNQLISGLNTAGLNNANTALQGAGTLNTLGLNNFNSALQAGIGQGTVRNQSLFPYASVATALSGTQTGMGALGSALTQAGANGLGGLFQNLFGGGTGSGLLGGLTGDPSLYSSLSTSSGVPYFLADDASGLAPAASDAGSYLSSFGDISNLGFSPAGGEAATGLGTAAPVTADSLSGLGTAAPVTADSLSGGAGAASSSLGSVSPGMAALPAAAMLAIAAHQPGVSFNQNYWNGLNSTLAAGPGSGGSSTDLSGIKQYTGYEGAMADLANAYAGQRTGSNNQIPTSEWQTLAGYGITPQMLASYNNTQATAALNMPTLMAQNDLYGIPNYSTTSRQKL